MMNNPEYWTQETIEEEEITSEESLKKKTRWLTRLGSIKESDMEVNSIDLWIEWSADAKRNNKISNKYKTPKGN